MRNRHHSEFKIALSPTEITSVKTWLDQMRQYDQNFSDIPEAFFGSNYVKLDIQTAIAVMPWTDTRTSGDLDAHRFKKHVLTALHALESKEKSPWWRAALTKAIELIQDTPVGEYMTGPAPKATASGT